jgi:integral membrane protein (TIGR00529 family)
MIDLLKFVLVLGLIIFLLIRKWDLGLSLLLGAVLIAALFLYPPLNLISSIFYGLVAKETLNLVAAVFLVLMLAELLRRTRSIEKMVASLQAVIPDSRIVIALLPTLIGLMPMLGGAMFSAPMVDEIGTRLKLSADRKTFINYWFRHSMEYVFPLYPSLLTASTLLGVSPYDFIGVSYPLTLASIAGGIIWGLWGIHRQNAPASGQSKGAAWKELLSSIWPLLSVILPVVVLKLNMLISLGAVSALLVLVKRIGPSQWLDVLKRSFPPRTFSAILGVMVFKRVLEDAKAVEAIPAALGALGLPPLLVAFIVPLITGLLTGTAIAAMALSIPLVAPLLVPLPVDYLAGGAWMFVGGFSGALLSPLHLCLALTRDYFKASWGRLYRAIVPAVGLVIAIALGIVAWRSGA